MPDRVQGERAARLQELLGLTEDELCRALGVDPLTLLSGQLEHRPELPILLDLLDEASERAGAPVLRRWVRAAGPAGRPVNALTRRDFAAFEDALDELAERGFVIRGGGAGAS
jgi:transcriptional regulator with XRE-family HTH domain